MSFRTFLATYWDVLATSAAVGAAVSIGLLYHAEIAALFTHAMAAA